MNRNNRNCFKSLIFAVVVLVVIAIVLTTQVDWNGFGSNIPEIWEGDQLSPVPLVNRETDEIVLAGEQNVTYGTGGANQEVEFYRNGAYDCGLTGKYTFIVLNPKNSDAQDEAPLWVYLHGGGSGYWDEDGNYLALYEQDEDTFNHEETFDDHIGTVATRFAIVDGEMMDNTLTRRRSEGYRMMLISMCDHDQYLGMGSPYPNNPTNPDAEVNGLQATMAAIDYTVANYPTTHVFVHGTSAASAGAYAVGLSYAAEGIALTGVVTDSILGSRATIIQNQLSGEPGFPQQLGYDSAEVSAKVGPWLDEDNRLFPEDRFGYGLEAPNLQIGGSLDPSCAGDFDPLPEALADGFQNNCAWMAEPLIDLSDDSKSLHEVVLIKGEGQAPTITEGASHDVVDAFIERALNLNPSSPFEK